MKKRINFLKQWFVMQSSFLLSSFITISFACFLLYVFGVPTQYLLYCFLLLCGFVMVLSAVMYYRSMQKLRYYQKLVLGNSWEEEQSNPIEQFLLTTIKQDRQQLTHLMSDNQQKQYDQLDYYTLWGHQIKTPISSTLLLIDQLENQETKWLLKQELFKVQQYADSLLYYLRMSSFHQDLVLQSEPIAEIVKQTVKKFSIFFIHKDIRLELGELTENVITDKKWLSVVIEQIVSNSLKYTTKGSISIAMHDQVLIIRDTGIGIKKSDLPRVFERGYSGYNGRVDMHSTGLGLYLVKEILNQLGHSITIESQLGVGTVVKIDLKQSQLQAI